MMRFISVFKNHGTVFFPVAALCMTFDFSLLGKSFFLQKYPCGMFLHGAL